MMGCWPYGYGMMGGWGWLGLLFQLALLALLVYGLVRLLSRPVPGVTHNQALEILRQRYAKGEIDQATFERMKEVLRQ